MGFSQILGNEQLKQNLQTGIARGRTSHGYLICGPAGSGKHTLARVLAAAMLCQQPKKPCMQCAHCRKVMAGTHPDYITIDDPEKKVVPVDLVRHARSDIYTRPNEGEKKIYLFPRAQNMEQPGQNALLKILEEPPAYGVFLLLSDNPEKLLPTVRSRCVILKMQSLPESVLTQALKKEFPDASAETLQAVLERSGGYLGQARALLEQPEEDPQTEAFMQAMLRKDPLLLLQTLVPMEKWKRDQLCQTLEQWVRLLQEALLCRNGTKVLSPLARELGNVRSSRELMQAVQAIKKAIEYAGGNVSPAAICGYLSWVLR